VRIGARQAGILAPWSDDLLPAALADRKAYGAAAAQGLSVIEHRPADRKAADELARLARCLISMNIV